MGKIIFINLRNVREDNDLKQKDLAKLISVSPRTYSHYENYEREMPIATWKLDVSIKTVQVKWKN